MTKADKFNSKKDPAVKEREATFRKHLGIPLNRFARIKNYCEDIDEDMKYRFSVVPGIDVKVLQLLTQVCGKYYSHNITHNSVKPQWIIATT